MLVEISRQLGAGALLGWAALPLLIRLARRSRHEPAAYYRALVAALFIAAAVAFAPAVRGLSGTALEWSLAPRPSVLPITVVADWVSPLVGSRAQAWPSMPLARALSALGLLWLFTFMFGAVRSLVGRFRLARSYRAARIAPARVLERARSVAAELGIAAPVIRVADDVASAFTFGFRSPVVVLGPGACESSEEALDFVLRHELTHVARGDARAALWIELAEGCFSGHPCRRTLDREIRFAREAAVDEAAAGPRAFEYARFLLGLAEQLESRGAARAALMSMADTALERRIEMLMSKKRTVRSRGAAAWLGLSGLVLGAAVFLAPSSFGQSTDAGASQAKVTGNLRLAQIQQVLFGKPRPLIDCYGRLPPPRDNLSLRLMFEIAENGSVASGRVESPAHPELTPCLEAALRSFVFSAPSSGRVQVDMPTELSPPLEERNARAEAKEGVSQRLPAKLIQDTVRGYFAQFASCYEAFPQPRPATRALLKFTIGRNGSVIDGEVEAKDYPTFARCLDPVMRSMVFPAPGDGIVTVVYPVEFAP